jgi:anti-sigma regulatory factor (Ser/Thr protein kinase)
VPPARVADAVFAVNEVVTNSLCHGGGAGLLYAWEVPGAAVFEIRDEGRIADPMIGRARPDNLQPSGRGLWMVNELCDLVQMRSGEWGSSVRIWVTAEA